MRREVATGLNAAPGAGEEEDVGNLRGGRAGVRQGATSGRPVGRVDQFAQVAVLAVLFAAPALMCVYAANAADPDLWWHLRTGEWIVQHHAVPRVDPFSGPVGGRPWAAYSWLFEVLGIKLFGRFGLAGTVGYTAGMVLAITVAFWRLVRRLQADFSIAVLLTFVACVSLGHLFTPRPWLFTIFFFAIEMDILMHARRTGRARELAWLPVIFALWSNLHIQFVDGLVVLAIAVGEAVFVGRSERDRARLPAGWLLAALLGSAAAALANPYGWRIYGVAYELAAQQGVLGKIVELQAIPFRDLCDFGVLSLTLGAAMALGWKRRGEWFEFGALGFAAFVSFRSQRDVWVMVTVAAAILASTIRTIRGRETNAGRLPGWATALAAIAAGGAVLAGFRGMGVNNGRLQADVAKSFPVRAVEAVEAKGYAGPLYNDFAWGGYLMWTLRMPVSIDGRAALYGDERIDRSIATWNAEPDWGADPELMGARLVIGPVKAPLVQVLRMDTRFELVFEDGVAAVFVVR